MPYDYTLVAKCGFTVEQLETAIKTLQTEILSDGDARVTSLSTPALSISFGDNGPLRTELLRAFRYAIYVKEPNNSEYQDARMVREVSGICL